MVELNTLIEYTNTLLGSEQIQDYCPNGLQVEGKQSIDKIVGGVTANQKLISQAIEHNADAILVHHGYFWKNENPCLIGMKGARIRQLIQHNINLIAYHLPLDLHTVYGNNALWGKAMGFDGKPSDLDPLIYHAQLSNPIATQDFIALLSKCLNRSPLHLCGGNKKLTHIAWCSGGAQGFIEKAAQLGVDAFLSGEVSEQTMHIASELGIDYFSCGHHATEIFGVRALGEHLVRKFSIEYQFIDIPNPV
jgi:dinuclear metal center YbgI/SA1388 family protein